MFKLKKLLIAEFVFGSVLLMVILAPLTKAINSNRKP